MPHERRVLRCRRHWAMLLPQVALTAILLMVLVGVSTLLTGTGPVGVFSETVLWYVELGVLVRLAVIMADWWDDILMVTDERILNVTGLFASRMRDTPIAKITDRDINHSILGNVLGYGTITIESAGHKSLQRLRFVPDPMTVFEAIAKLTSKHGLPAPAEGPEISGSPPSIEDQSAAWPERDED